LFRATVSSPAPASMPDAAPESVDSAADCVTAFSPMAPFCCTVTLPELLALMLSFPAPVVAALPVATLSLVCVAPLPLLTTFVVLDVLAFNRASPSRLPLASPEAFWSMATSPSDVAVVFWLAACEVDVSQHESSFSQSSALHFAASGPATARNRAKKSSRRTPVMRVIQPPLRLTTSNTLPGDVPATELRNDG